jgi:acyl transferase domain-containing protein
MISKEQVSAVIDLWKDVLKVSDVELDRGFADLGGTSLAANQFVARLGQQFGIKVPVIRVFEYPTLRLLLRFLVEGAVAPAAKASAAASKSRAPKPSKLIRENHDVAIIGMACRFPGARNLEEFWKNLLDGRDTITILDDNTLSPEVPAEMRSDPRYVRAAGLIDDPYGLDAEFFAINPAEAKLIDPQQRVLLEVAWHALEHAGEAPGRMTERVAVYAGTEDNSYYRADIVPFPAAERRAGRFSVMTGNEKDYVAMRIAHKLNLKGPAVSVHTACSTSLVAVIMACKSLRMHECDMALAGGASVHFPTPEGYYYQEGGVFSSDGHCRPFDKSAQGTNFTDGAGLVVLKRVEDAIRDGNTIFAVIKGGAINSDGGDRSSFSAPSVNGQAACIRDALTDAGVDAGTLQFLEAHGTATPIGDPIEIEGLRQAFATRADPTRLQYCGLGSVKSNIGHTTAAAGVASLIKTAMALRHTVIPGTVHFESPNPGLEIENSPFYVVAKTMDWPRGEPLRRAGISSFGIGGTNSHLIVEEAPPQPIGDAAGPERPFELWPVSAKSVAQRDQLLQSLSMERYWPRDVAHTLQTGRARFPYRGARVRLNQLPDDDLLVQPQQAALEEATAVFMFPGQGAQYIGMGRSLYESIPEFRATFSRCCELLSAELGLDFRTFIFDDANVETLENTRFTQPALFAIEVSLGRMLLDFGLQPAYMIGHSIGEFAAAHLAGVFSLEDAVRLIAARGRLMAELPRGRMLSARGAVAAVVAAAGEAVDVASINGPVHSVLAGDFEQIARVQARLEAADIPCRPLHTSHAFHSAMMQPVVAPFLDIVRGVKLSAPQMAIISTVTGEVMTAADATNPEYWAGHLRATVKFSPAVFKALELGGNVFLECGPRTTLSSLAVQHFASAGKTANDRVAVSMLGDSPAPAVEIGGVGSALARLWCAGIELPWERIWAAGRKVPLVTAYPFTHKQFRFSEGRQPELVTAAHGAAAHGAATGPSGAIAAVAAAASGAPNGSAGQAVPGRDEKAALVAQLGQLFSEYSGLAIQSPQSSFVELGFDSLLLMQIGVQIGKLFGVSVALRDLMQRLNTLPELAGHILAVAAPDKLQHLRAVAPAAMPVATAAAPAAVSTPASASASASAPTSVPAINGAATASQTLTLAADDVQSIRTQLQILQALVAQHQRHLEQLAPGIVAAGNGAALAPPAAGAPGGNAPLLRAQRAQPPTAGAFRANVGNTQQWVSYDAATRRYELIER